MGQVKRRQNYQSYSGGAVALALMLLLHCCQQLQAEIAHQSLPSNRVMEPKSGHRKALAQPPKTPCKKNKEMLQRLTKYEDLYLDVPAHYPMNPHQKRRYVLQLNKSTPLTIRFSTPVDKLSKWLIYNDTVNLLQSHAGATVHSRELVLPCALRGQYDLVVMANSSLALDLEAQAVNPRQNWSLLNSTHHLTIRTQNRVRKGQMIVKWNASKIDTHAIHYCLVVKKQHSGVQYENFCEAVHAYAQQPQAHNRRCHGSTLEAIWGKKWERVRTLNAKHEVHIVCTGLHIKQTLLGLQSNTSYQLDVFGIHQARFNLTFRLGGTVVHFNRKHPVALHQHALELLKIGGMHGVQVYSFKVPHGMSTLRYLLLPCSGSEIQVKLLRQRQEVYKQDGIFNPTYLPAMDVQAGERYLMRIEPSNEDEALRAQKVRVAITGGEQFKDLPQLPENITVFDVSRRCTKTTIAWYRSPDVRPVRYCVILFNFPHRNRSGDDYTNYCMNFALPRMKTQSNFFNMTCRQRKSSPDGNPLETETILNLTPGTSYLVYVTANLSKGKKSLPYQALTVHLPRKCPSASSSDQQSYN